MRGWACATLSASLFLLAGSSCYYENATKVAGSVKGHQKLTCLLINGERYCFPTVNTVTTSLPTDSGAGILVNVPAQNRALKNCNSSYWRLMSADPELQYPSFSLDIGELGSSTEGVPVSATRESIFSSYKALVPSLVERDKSIQARSSCLPVSSNLLSDKSSLCVDRNDEGYIESYQICDRAESTKNPGCQQDFVFRDIGFRASYSLSCKGLASSIANSSIEFVNTSRMRGE